MKTTCCALAALTAAFVSCGATTVDDCTDYLETSDKSYDASSLVLGDHWHSKNVPGSGSTNYVGAGMALLGPNTAAPSPQYPDVLVLEGKLAEYVDLTWPELRLQNGSLYYWASNKGLKGKVVVESTDVNNPAQIQIYSTDTYRGASVTLKARLLGGPDSVFALVRPTVKLPPPDIHYYVPIANAWTEFEGTCLVETNATLSFQANANGGNNACAGRIVVKEGGLWLGMNNWGYPSVVWTTVGGLEMQDGSQFWSRCDTAGRASLVVVTNELKLGKINLRFIESITGEMKECAMPAFTVGTPVKIPLFKLVGAAAEKEVDLSQVTLPDHPQMKTLGYPRQKALVCEANADGSKTIYAKYFDDDIKWVMNTANAQTFAESAFNPANTGYWKDSLMPSGDSDGAVYASAFLAFRGETDDVTYSFPNLTFFASSTIYMYAAELTVSNFVLKAGQNMYVHIGNTVKHLRGRMTLLPGASPVNLLCYSQRTCYIDAELCGDGDLQFKEADSVTPPATFCLTAVNTNFHGGIVASMHFEGKLPATIGLVFPDPAKDWYTTIVLNDGRNLGGTYAGADSWRSLTLGDWTKLTIDPAVTQVTLDEPTRGILITNDCAQVDLQAGQMLVVKEPITYHGQLLKRGEGTLALGGEARFTNGDPAMEPTADLNRLVVSGGVVKAVSPMAMNGLQVEVSDGAALGVDAASAAMADRGIVNTRWTAPFVARTTDGLVPVKVEGVTGDADVVVPLLTVGAEASKTLRVSVKRVPGFRAAVAQRANDDGTVTYVAGFTRTGMSLIIR